MRKILLIDDDALVRDPIEEFLKDEDYQVSVASNGNEGLTVFQAFQPHIIVLDLQMPQMGGLEFLQHLPRQIELSTSVIILTSYETNEIIQTCFQLGVQSFLRKPVNLYELGGLLKNMFKRLERSSTLEKTLQQKENDYQSLASQHETLRKTVDAMQEGIVTLNKNLTIEMISTRACQILEVAEADMLGKRAGAVFPDSVVGREGVLSRCIQEQSELSNVLIHYPLSGQSKPLSLTATPMNDTTLDDGWMLMFQDIDEQDNPISQKTPAFAFGRMIGRSSSMQTLFELIQKISHSNAAVLVQGNSGTGKELVAREIHERSQRNQRLFHAVNCAAISPHLLESEFFGHERGAFSGAHQLKKGRFELAHEGTLFLDEVGELPLELQGKLLRALQEQTFERVGGTHSIKVDVRIIAATNKDLKAMIQNCQFREDLYFRLCVISIHLDDLCERLEDIPLLVSAFIQELNQKENRHIEGISTGALQKLMHYAWPGNIRELFNVIEYAFAINQGSMIQIEHLPAEIQKSQPPHQPHNSANDNEKNRILEALQQTNSHKVKAAGLLGMHPATLYRKLKKYKIA